MSLPKWALRKAGIEDYAKVNAAVQKGVADFQFLHRNRLKAWMSQHGWKKSWFFPEEAFAKQASADKQKYETALNAGIVEIRIPIEEHKMGAEVLRDMDDLYVNREWDTLANDLKQYIVLLKYGVKIEAEGSYFSSAGNFYNWLHTRYPALEDAVDDWILDAR